MIVIAKFYNATGVSIEFQVEKYVNRKVVKKVVAMNFLQERGMTVCYVAVKLKNKKQ